MLYISVNLLLFRIKLSQSIREQTLESLPEYAKRVLRCPVYGTLALEPSKRVPENPRTLLGTFKGSIVPTQGTYKGPPECLKNL